MSDEESTYYPSDPNPMFDPPEKKVNNEISTGNLEPFGNEETAEVKYRTMKWW